MARKAVIAVGQGPSSSAPFFGGSASAALTPVGNRPIVAHALEALQRAGVEEVAMVASQPAGEAVRDAVGDGERFGLRVEHLPARDDGIGSALLAARELVGDERFILHTGDGLLGGRIPPFGEADDEGRPDAVLLVHRPREHAPVDAQSRRLLRCAGVASPGPALEVSGITLFGPGALAGARRALEEQRRDVGLCGLVDRLPELGGRVHLRVVQSWARFRGSADDLLQLNRMVLDRLRAGGELSLPDGSRIEGRVEIDPSATVEASVIRGPVAIGPRARIINAYIGPYTAIGADAVVDGAEVEHSVLLDGATVTHTGARLESSVVGRCARIYRDFELPRAVRLQVGDGATVALA